MSAANPWEHLQSTLMRVQNRLVQQEFNDVNVDNIAIPRASLKIACRLDDNDNAQMVILRLILFYIILRKAQDLHPAIYGVPVINFQEQFRFLPQVKLFFVEDAQDVAQGFSEVYGEISFRIMRETSETFTPANARLLANRIKSLFGTGNGFIWRKGRVTVVYHDLARGYHLRVLARSEAEGTRVVEQVLDIQSHSIDRDFLSVVENKKTFSVIPPLKRIYGKSRRLPRQRPIAEVRFKYAELHLHGMPNAVVLYDRTGLKKNPLVTD